MATQANASSGSSFPAFKALFEQKAKPGSQFAAWTAEAFDSAFIIFLAALEAKSSDPAKIAEHVVSVTNPPGKPYTFQQLDQAIGAILEGQRVHFHGATGPIQFTKEGRVSSTAYDVWQVKPDGNERSVQDDHLRRSPAPGHRPRRPAGELRLRPDGSTHGGRPGGGPRRPAAELRCWPICFQILTLNGLITGAILALTAGASPVFGIQRVANFAHGGVPDAPRVRRAGAERGFRRTRRLRHRREGATALLAVGLHFLVLRRSGAGASWRCPHHDLAALALRTSSSAPAPDPQYGIDQSTVFDPGSCGFRLASVGARLTVVVADGAFLARTRSAMQRSPTTATRRHPGIDVDRIGTYVRDPPEPRGPGGVMFSVVQGRSIRTSASPVPHSRRWSSEDREFTAPCSRAWCWVCMDLSI